jgi:urea transport system ATP-binding protein
VPQGREIIPEFSVHENILMGTFARRDGRRVVPGIVYELFPYLAANPDRPGGLLSGGQQQQLAPVEPPGKARPRLILLSAQIAISRA